MSKILLFVSAEVLFDGAFSLCVSLNQMSEFSHGEGLMKFNKSLLLNKVYVEKIKEHIFLTIKILGNDDLRDEKIRWEYLKYEIRKSNVRFSKNLSKEVTKETQSLEQKVKYFEGTITTYSTYNIKKG